ncbi:putative Tektin-2 [Hypsibius exemplaris]|uniref:Tektin n=1 Tax=Hypsibius exemplaris TaxID=2072580 RepID=A0A1W0X2Z7_HYPEX|nr:putative Tektin-2 [Hypsibius exemplaris]
MAQDHGYLPCELEQFNRNMEHASADIRGQALHERHGAEWLRQEAKLRTSWDEHGNRMRLKDRIDHVKALRSRLQEVWDLVDREEKLLGSEKTRLDKGLTGRHDLIMNVSGECEMLSQAREGINNVHDEVEDRLRKERELATQIRRDLERKNRESLKVLEDLQRVKHLLTKDLEDKDQAVNSDQAQLDLTHNSHSMSLKPDILRIPRALVTMRAWLERSLENLRLATRLLDNATVLRNHITTLFSKVMHDSDKEAHATDFAYRKRYHDTLMAARKLDHNRQNLAEEIKAVENDIQATQTAEDNLTPSMKLAHTRIENRNQRPNHELTMDVPQEGLLLEAGNLAHFKAALFHKNSLLRARWNDLREQLHRVELDLDRKLKCLEMDKRAMTLRQGSMNPVAEKNVIDHVVERHSKALSMDPDERYRKEAPRVLV